MPGAGRLTPKELQGIAEKSNGVLRDLGPEIQWVHSYVTDDKIYCVYVAPNAELIREHARKGGFPANKISPVGAVMDPTTAENRSPTTADSVTHPGPRSPTASHVITRTSLMSVMTSD